MHQLEVKNLLKRPTDAHWSYECNFITQWLTTWFGHSCIFRVVSASIQIYLQCVTPNNLFYLTIFYTQQCFTI